MINYIKKLFKSKPIQSEPLVLSTALQPNIFRFKKKIEVGKSIIVIRLKDGIQHTLPPIEGYAYFLDIGINRDLDYKIKSTSSSEIAAHYINNSINNTNFIAVSQTRKSFDQVPDTLYINRDQIREITVETVLHEVLLEREWDLNTLKSLYVDSKPVLI